MMIQESRCDHSHNKMFVPFIFYMYMCVLEYMYVYHVHAVPEEAREGTGFPQKWVQKTEPDPSYL